MSLYVLLLLLSVENRLPGGAEMLVPEIEEPMRRGWVCHQILHRSEELEREPVVHLAADIGIARLHEVGPIGLHLVGELLLAAIERRVEVEQELQLHACSDAVGKPNTSLGGMTGSLPTGGASGSLNS